MKHRGTVLSLIGLALTLAVTAASAQTYTVLHTYPSRLRHPTAELPFRK